MPSNGLSSRRRNFPRPAVCKESNPNHCRPGEITFKTTSINSSGGGSWTLQATWTTTPGEPQLFGKAENTTNAGSVTTPIDVATNAPFTFDVQQFAPGDQLIVFVVVTTPDACKYLGVAKTVAPPIEA